MINRLLGMPVNAAEHGAQIDQMLEVVHWFMLALFVFWGAFFAYCLMPIWHLNPKSRKRKLHVSIFA